MENNLKKYEIMAKEFMLNASRVQQRKLGANILAFADTHYEFTKREEIERIYDKYHDADVVALLGDHNPYFIDLLLQYFPADIIVPVLGNHDVKSAYRDFGLRELHGDIVTIKGITLGGISGSHKYKCNNRYSLITQEESLEICNKLLTKPAVDILLTHDIVFSKEIHDTAHCGLIGITRYIFADFQNGNAGPVAHLHGHLHRSFRGRYSNYVKEVSVYGVEYISL